MTQAPETVALVDALRASVSGQAMPLHVGQLRLQVESALGPERARQLRREVHQVMVAAEEHLPSRLTQVRPLTTATLSRLASELATTRSWALPTAERTTRIWAAALGFEHLAEVEWPAYVPAQRPSASIDSLEIGRTAPPPAPASPERAVAWPTTSKRLAKNHPTASGGEVPRGVAPAYSGMPLPVYLGLLVALTMVLVVALFLLPPFASVVLPLLAFGLATALTRAAGQGALLATAAGLEYVAYTGLVGRPAAEPSRVAPWSDITVDVGTFSTITFAGHAHQLSPLARAFAEAAAQQAEQP